MNEEHYLLFDQYLQDEMTVEEKHSFEKQLSNNQEMAVAFENFKEMNLQLDAKFGFEQERKAFKKNVAAISETHFSKKKTKVITLKTWYYGAAASVAVLVGMFFLNQNVNPNFDDYNQPENAFFTERGDINANLKLAQDAFNAREYEKAIPLFETILKEDKTAEIQYFYGVSLLEVNQFSKADIVFNELKGGSSVYKNKAIWNLALVQLKQKNYKACKALLLTIPEDYEGNDAVNDLLEELE